MAIKVSFSDNPAWVLNKAKGFLKSEPVHHNLILTLLHARIARCQPGRYWVAMDSDAVVGVVFQSPLSFRAVVTPIVSEVVPAVVDAISDAGVALPGVSGDVATAARFAGQWAEHHKSAVVPFMGQRLYEVNKVQELPAVSGHFRKAVLDDRERLLEWIRCFSVDIGEPESNPKHRVDRQLAAEQLWVWDNVEPVSLAARTTPVEGVVRVQLVYTPSENRNRGYASACVGKLSKHIRDEGYRCILYTDLGNPTSNAVYRRIGYRAVAEGIQYRFE